VNRKFWRVLAAIAALPMAASAQTPTATPVPKPVLVPQPFQPNVSETEVTTPSVENPNAFSPWYDVMNDLQLPDTFDPRQAADTALTGQAEAAAADTEGTSVSRGDVPFSDLFIENTEGSLLATPEGSLFTAESLLLSSAGPSYAGLSKESELPFGESAFPLLYTPRAIPIFKRVRALTPVGPFRLGVDLGVSSAYNDNVFGEPSNRQGDLITTLMPVIFLEAGTRGSAQLLYAPTVVNFAKYKDLSSVNQAVFFRLRYPFTKLKLGLDAFYLTSSGLFISNDQGGFAQQSTFLTRLFGEYPVTDKVMVELMGESVWQNTDPGGSQTEQSLKGRVYYQVTPSVKAGMSLKVGMYDAPAEDQVYQALELSSSWRVTDSFVLSGEAGIEMRHLSLNEQGRSELGVPICNIQINYNPASTMLYNVTFYRDVLNTTFNDVSLNITTGARTSVLIRFFERINFRLEMGFGYTEQLTDESSEDGHYSFVQGGVTVSYQFANRVEVQIFDNLQQRFGGNIGNDYVSNTIGVALTLKF
jgi:hypothetical protein